VQLQELIAGLNELDEHGVICVKRPWTANAEAQLAALDENLSIPASVLAAGYAYFLEVHVAREIVGVFEEKPSTLDEMLRLLIHYAEHDAYPDWVYSSLPQGADGTS
jgi:hypothetical protein